LNAAKEGGRGREREREEGGEKIK
jgi:hypothetical protein